MLNYLYIITGYFFIALLAIRSVLKSTELYNTNPRHFAERMTLLVYIQKVPILNVDCNSGYLYPGSSNRHSFTVLWFNLINIATSDFSTLHFFMSASLQRHKPYIGHVVITDQRKLVIFQILYSYSRAQTLLGGS